MKPSYSMPYYWLPFSEEHLPLILHHQKELYSLNFKKLRFDPLFFSNIRHWYLEGIPYQDCDSFLLFDPSDQLIGFYLFQKNDSTIYLMQMFVEKSYRRKGYGTILLKHYEQAGMGKGASSSFLHASSMNMKAVSFYQRNDYIIIDQETDEDDSPRYFMFKNLQKK